MGTLIIDVPITIIVSNFVMGPNAQIFVQEGNTFAAVGSNFYSCDDMWQGIVFESQSSGVFFGNRIEDAHYAFTVDDGAVFNLTSNFINRNHVGLRNSNASGNGLGLNAAGFSNNVFTSSSKLRSPRSSEYGYCGIMLNQVVASLGSGSAKNHINETEFGIIANQSDVVLQNFEISNLQNTLNNSVGIKLDDGTASINGHNAIIQNCGLAGIEALGTNIEVKNYIVQGIQDIGITSRDNIFAEDVNIHDNIVKVLKDESIGIQLIRSAGSGYINKIENNTVTVDGDGSTGIASWGQLPSFDQCEISNNTISLKTTASGIVVDVNLGRFYNIQENIITFDFSGSAFANGVILNNGEEFPHDVSFNIIQGTYNQIQGANGIGVNGVRDVTYCTNIVNNSQVGMNFTGFNSPSRLLSNQMNHHNIGFLVDNGGATPGAIGEQVRNSNTWLEDFNNSVYSEFAAQCNANPDFSRIITQNNSATILPPLRTPGGNIWFEEIGGRVNGCDAQSPGDDYEGMEGRIINQGIESVSEKPLHQWELLNRIYYGLLKKDASQYSETEQSFLETYSSHSAAKYAKITNRIGQATAQNYEITSALKLITVQQKELLNQLAILDNSILIPEEYTDIDLSIAEDKAVLLDKLKELSHQASALETQIQTNLIIELISIDAELKTLPENENWEQNQKFMFGVMLKVLQSQQLTDADKATIRIIAAQCLIEGGSVVNTARAYLPLSERNDLKEEDCSEIEDRSKDFNVSERENTFVYPNPASDVINISTSSEEGNIIEILDISGRIVQSISDFEGTLLNVSQLEAGLYFLKVSDELGLIKTEKFIKQ